MHKLGRKGSIIIYHMDNQLFSELLGFLILDPSSTVWKQKMNTVAMVVLHFRLMNRKYIMRVEDTASNIGACSA